jgi:hypothetical protein
VSKTETRAPSLNLQKTNSKWVKDLNVRPETWKLLEKNIGKTFQDVGIGKNFLNRTLIAQGITARTDK